MTTAYSISVVGVVCCHGGIDVDKVVDSICDSIGDIV